MQVEVDMKTNFGGCGLLFVLFLGVKFELFLILKQWISVHNVCTVLYHKFPLHVLFWPQLYKEYSQKVTLIIELVVI